MSINPGRRRLLRPQAGIRAARSPSAATGNAAPCSSTSSTAERLGAELYRRGRRRPSPVMSPPRHCRLAGALHRRSDRALCRQVPALAGAGPGAVATVVADADAYAQRSGGGAEGPAGLRGGAGYREPDRATTRCASPACQRSPICWCWARREAGKPQPVTPAKTGGRWRRKALRWNAANFYAGRPKPFADSDRFRWSATGASRKAPRLRP